jgi:CRP-like cAMP-binding protein
VNKNSLIQLFTGSGLVSHISAGQMADFFDPVVYAKAEFFLKEGSIANHYFFLENGFMRSFAYDIDGKDITTNFYSAGQIVFEVSSFFRRTRSQENILALTDCNGWQITYEGLNKLFHDLPEFREFGRSILVKHLSLLKTRMLSMITETAEERYKHLISNNPEIFQYAALKDIATFLGITDTSLSRIRRELTH